MLKLLSVVTARHCNFARHRTLLFSTTIVHRDTNHYKVLGIEKTASREEVDSAYFNKVKQLKHLSGRMSDEMKQCLEAYETLIDDDCRRLYDQQYSSEDVSEIVKSMSENKGDPNSVPMMSQSNNKKNNQEDALSDKQFFWAVKMIGSLFLIITVPKVLYIGWKEIRSL